MKVLHDACADISLPAKNGPHHCRIERAAGRVRRPGHFRSQKQVNSKGMTKQQLIEKVAAKTELSKGQVEVAVDSVLEQIAEALRSNERVDLRGFGSFVVKDRKERQGRNPRTGETITIPAKRDAAFKPSKELSEKLVPGETVQEAPSWLR